MRGAVDLAEVWRGGVLESVHRGHAVICDENGGIVEAWGNPETLVYPRSSAKFVQALALVESGAADAFGLRKDQIALACASHIGASYHTDRVKAWIGDLGLSDDAFRCGPQMPTDEEASRGLIKTDTSPCQYHNNCSGKHSGFLTLGKHLRAGAEYVDIDHPVQIAVKAAFEEVTGVDSPGWGIDGCSAPNHQTTVRAMAHAMAKFATAGARSGARDKAMVRIFDAVTTHPELVSGNDKPCTELMRACGGQVAIKGGAEAFYVASIPSKRMGVALKVADGSSRGSEVAIAALLVRLGVLDPKHPVAARYLNAPITNWRGIVTGELRAAGALV